MNLSYVSLSNSHNLAKSRRVILLTILTAVLAVFSAGSAQAITPSLVSWDFTIPDFVPNNNIYFSPPYNGNLGLTSDQSATSTALGLTASDLSAPQGIQYGSGFTYSNNGNSYDALTVYSGVSATTLAAAIANNSYFTFTVTPDAGMILNLSSITVQVGTYQPEANLSSYVEASTTGFTSSRSLGHGANGTVDNSYGVGYQDYKPYTVNLSSPVFQGLTVPTEFRIYVPEVAYETVGLQAVALNGSVEVNPVPEPAQFGFFIALSVAGLAFWRRFSPRSL